MVCNMESVVIPRPPPAPPLGAFQVKSGSVRSKRSNTSQGGGFRLQEDQGDTASIYSVYKQKIDAMFESDSSSQINNCVQARIEKMFTDVEKDHKDTGSGGSKSGSEIGNHVFSIDYLGSVPLLQKVTSLAGLQHPLKELYFGYKKITKHKKPLTGRLEISQSGLKVQYQGENGDLEQLNPFPTIAVWSAVKFVLHNDDKPTYAFLPLITDPDNIDKQSLFMNLESADKKYITKDHSHSPLFAVVMRKIGVHKQLECHGFVCQTSEDAIVIAATLYKSLMAHMKAKDKKPKNRNGVSCMSIASSNNNDSGSNLVPVRPPRKKRSTTSSMSEDNDPMASHDPNDPNKGGKKSLKNRRAPKVPPPLSEAAKKQMQDMDAILPYEEPTQLGAGPSDESQMQEIKPEKWNSYMSPQQKQIAEEIKQVISEGSNRGLKRVQSLRKRSDDGVMSKSSENSGDILTKVTIPRSGSFLNAGGLTRYKSKVSRANGQASGGSPLGFNELFNEFRLQEGLHSMDEILGVIIDSEGMSFNDLKPIYKEFLLKLAVTLTKDELYARSKSIMRRQKKKLLRRNSSVKNKRHGFAVGTKGLKKAFRKSFKIRFGSKKIKKTQGGKVVTTLELKKKAIETVEPQLPESSISTSSYDTRQFRPKQNSDEGGPSGSKPVARKQSYKKRASEISKVPNSRIRRDRTSTSEDSDFFTLKRSKSKMASSNSNQNRNSSSGYVSCSECSYDSDTCTCVSADKCYCSLGHKQFPKSCNRSSIRCKSKDKCYCTIEKLHNHPQKLHPTPQTPDTLSWCGCDTDSCTDSNKCYCQNVARLSQGGHHSGHHGGPKGTIFEQLKQRGFIPSNEAMITPPNQRKLAKKYSNTKSTKSLEYMSNPSEMYYERMRPKSRSLLGTQTPMFVKEPRRSYSSDNLALDYELFTITNGSFHNVQHNRAIYARAISECGRPPGFSRQHQNSVRSYNGTATRYSGRLSGRTVKSTSVANGGPGSTEALSVKKSAEIAALFADIKLSQTTDITHLMPTKDFEPDPLISSRGSGRSGGGSGRSGGGGGGGIYDIYNRPPSTSALTTNALINAAKNEKRMIQNSLYASKMPLNNMYSARNGLYTIQSQSDESRRSSVKRSSTRGEYFNLEPVEYGVSKGRPVSSGLENSLGYLP